MKNLLAPLVLVIAAGAALAAETPAAKPQAATVAELNAMAKRFAPVELRADTAALSKGDRAAIGKLIEAAKIIDTLQLRQRWSDNEALWAALQKDNTALGRARQHYFWLNKGPWSIIDGNASFMPPEYAGVRIPARKPEGANFYPAGASKEALEAWMNGLAPKDKEAAQWYFTVIRTGPDGKFRSVKYSDEYKPELETLARLLRDAAASTDNASLKKFLLLRADAFLSNDYLASDFAWMDLDAPVDITIGPYETYNDELFGYKAAFEAYVSVRDAKETQKLNFFGK
ncbi:MAG: hypothetical protein ABWY02_02415, partial [Telluria sp.]